MSTAPEILKRAAQHMEDRAAARDQAGGERSMARTVAAFNAITGHQGGERDGWLFMAVLKAARACTTATGIPDDYEDGAAYFGLAGEAAGGAQAKPANDNGRRVVFSGVSFNVPEGYNFVAQDENGAVCAYDIKPGVHQSQWFPGETYNYHVINMGDAPVGKWRASLIELPA